MCIRDRRREEEARSDATAPNAEEAPRQMKTPSVSASIPVVAAGINVFCGPDRREDRPQGPSHGGQCCRECLTSGRAQHRGCNM
eukprot:1738467-Rhodomonas_salina.1